MNIEHELEELAEPQLRAPESLNYAQRGTLLALYYNWLRETENPLKIYQYINEIVNLVSESEHSKLLFAIMQPDCLTSTLMQYFVELLACEVTQQEETLEELAHLVRLRLMDLRLGDEDIVTEW